MNLTSDVSLIIVSLCTCIRRSDFRVRKKLDVRENMTRLILEAEKKLLPLISMESTTGLRLSQRFRFVFSENWANAVEEDTIIAAKITVMVAR